MEKNLSLHIQEIIYGSSDVTLSKQISKLEKSGNIRKIAPRLYTSNLEDLPENIIRRNIFSILGNLYPNALLSHRSAFEFKPTGTNQIFVTYKYTRRVNLPGITIRFLEGNEPIQGDNTFSAKLFVSQRERALLENLQSSRQSGDNSKTLSKEKIEEYLEQIIRVNGEEELNKLRDKAREIADQLGWEVEFNKLNKIISALLSTHPSKILKSPVAIARAFGVPFDPSRIQLFEKLFHELINQEFEYRDEYNKTPDAFRSFAFFESYFSNYIEGTVFEIEEAEKVITTQKPLPARHDDSHDVLGTYQLVSNRKEMQIIPKTAEELLEILQYRHKVLLSSRIDKKPGKFKDKNNFAGNTAFVDTNLVRGTLLKSFEYYQVLSHPFAKAAYMMFVISEVHPFLDGNGRIARVMMNAELTAKNQFKIIIPTVYRDDYLGALRKLTRQQDPVVYIKMLDRAHRFSSTIVGSTIDQMKNILEQSNAFLEHTEGMLKILNL